MRKLLEAIAATAELMGREISPSAAMVMAQDLAQYPAEVTIAALANLRKEKNARFSTGAVIEQIERIQPDGRPGADEAWAMIPRDEYTSAVMTTEMAEALGIAQPLLNEGDQVAARMAFKEAYTSLVDEAKRAGKAPEWFPSLGHDPRGREAVLEEAVRLGRLPASQAAGLLPAPAQSSVLAIEDKRPEISAEKRAENLRRLHCALSKFKVIEGGKAA